jgi:ankyrin repeat protein
MVALLLAHGASTEVRDVRQQTPLYGAVFGWLEPRRESLKRAPPQTSYSLLKAEPAAYREIVRLLAAKGADVNAPDRLRNTPLHCAAEFGDREAVELLLSLGARLDLRNERNLTPADVARLQGHQDIAGLLQPTAAP